MGYMLDTNIFSRLAEGHLSIADIPADDALVATSVQREEIKRTLESKKRGEILSKFERFSQHEVRVAFSFGIAGAGFDQGEWVKEDFAQGIFAALESIRSKPNNREDAASSWRGRNDNPERWAWPRRI